MPVSAVRPKRGPYANKKPALVVLITVDQLRGDLLQRYRNVFTGGFRRLLDHGFNFTRATVDHAPTNSYPGHVTIATGAHPARHGIVDNSWIEVVNGTPGMTAGAADPLEKIVGFPLLEGVSPNRLQVTGIADWTLENDKGATVVNISSNEYGSLLHAGKSRGHTYWFSPASGQYVTSTYYRSDYPAWVERFNRETLPGFLNQKTWNAVVPRKFRKLALPDAMPFEFDNVNNRFPHRFESESADTGARAAADWFYFTPFGDAAALRLTREAVSELKLGRRGSTDYLSVTLGSTDSIGHRFGPLSLEQLDNLWRLDRELGVLFAFLDKQIGKGRYLAALTADHGGSNIPEHLTANGERAFRVTAEDMDKLLNEVREHAGSSKSAPETLRSEVAAIAEKYPFIADAMTRDELASAGPSNESVGLYKNSYFTGRSPIYPIVSSKYPVLAAYGNRVRLAENAVPYFAPANHGTGNFYDRHVALIFYGSGVRKGSSSSQARTVDVAPTLARLAGIPLHATVDGFPLDVGIG